MPKKSLVILHKEDPTYMRKSLNGLIRGSDRYDLIAVIDVSGTPSAADAGILLDGTSRGIPIVNSLRQVVEKTGILPEHCIHTWCERPQDGKVPDDLERHLLALLSAGVTLVNTSHFHLGSHGYLREAARRGGAAIIDLRKPKPIHDLSAWDEAIFEVNAPRIPVIGTDQAVGKRTTSRWLKQACRDAGIAAQMIYTGQTGWLQGGQYGLILDSTPADFIGGELVSEIIECNREKTPDVIFVEGQSSITHGTQPLGLDLIRPIGARGVILQHVPTRQHNIDTPCERLPIERDVRIVEALGAEVLAVTLNGEREPRGAILDEKALISHQETLAIQLELPVIRPLEEGMDELVDIVRRHIKSCT